MLCGCSQAGHIPPADAVPLPVDCLFFRLFVGFEFPLPWLLVVDGALISTLEASLCVAESDSPPAAYEASTTENALFGFPLDGLWRLI